MSVRFATPGPDLGAFEEMLRSCLLEQEKAGSPIRLTRRTLDWYRDLARNYVSGALFGALVLAEKDSPAGPQPIGFALGGEDLGLPTLDTTHGKQAIVWLIWVAPEHRQEALALEMLRFGRPRLLEMGFESAAMGVLEPNESGHALCLAYGARLVERLYRFPLKEEPGGQRK